VHLCAILEQGALVAVDIKFPQFAAYLCQRLLPIDLRKPENAVRALTLPTYTFAIFRLKHFDEVYGLQRYGGMGLSPGTRSDSVQQHMINFNMLEAARINQVSATSFPAPHALP